jgi:hypothetical protein
MSSSIQRIAVVRNISCPREASSLLESVFRQIIIAMSCISRKNCIQGVVPVLGSLRLVTNAQLPETIYGRYDRGLRCIFINPSIITNIDAARKTLFHEIAHVLSPDDHSHGQKFERALLAVTTLFGRLLDYSRKNSRPPPMAPPPKKRPCGKQKRRLPPKSLRIS